MPFYHISEKKVWTIMFSYKNKLSPVSFCKRNDHWKPLLISQIFTAEMCYKILFFKLDSC